MAADECVPTINSDGLWIHNCDIVFYLKDLLQRLCDIHMAAASTGGKKQNDGTRYFHHESLIIYSIYFFAFLMFFLHLNWFMLLNLSGAITTSLTYLPHEQDYKKKADHDSENKARESTKKAGHFLPAFCKGITQAKRYNHTQYLTTHIPEQKATIGVLFQSCKQIYRSPKHHDQETRKKDRPSCSLPEIGTRARHSLGCNPAEALLSLKPAQ